MGKRVLTMMSAKVFNESGKGYWMEGFGTLRAEGENRPTRPGHVIVLNDQGGGVMDVGDKSMTLRAQEHGHQPVVCFEPGISTRIGGGWKVHEQSMLHDTGRDG